MMMLVWYRNRKLRNECTFVFSSKAVSLVMKILLGVNPTIFLIHNGSFKYPALERVTQSDKT